MEPGQVRSLHGHWLRRVPGHICGMAARQRAAWQPGELAAAGTSVARGAVMHEVQRERLVARSDE